MQGASVQTRHDEARTRQIHPGTLLPDDELDRLIELRGVRGRVRLEPGVLVPGTRYRIDGWLGDGGTGVVYEATHEDLGRKVAIKVLHGEHSEDAEMAQTFREEARAATKIGSPYIVEVIDFAELPDGRLLYVMERLRGTSLDREVASAPMDMARLVGILRQVCQGLAAAHDAGLVHRDIKPEHMLVLDRDEAQAQGRADRIKIMDFGIAAVVGQAVDVQGTPSYMAPEQVLGMGVARQNDVYSLGCSAYELIVGHPPFKGESLKEVLRKHMREAPKPPSELLGPGKVPPAIEAVVLKCLAKKRVERYPDMRELEAALVEAQIESRIVTAWDDLPLPEVGTERLARMAAGLDELRAKEAPIPRRGWLVPALVGAGIAAVLAVGFTWVALKPDPAVIALAEARVEAIAIEAKDAAAKALYVYPSPNDPDGATAYRKVMELESLTGEERALGRERASALRKEFAATLERLGDRYWEKENGRPFARDYYVQAYMFDPSSKHAQERGGTTPGERTELKRKADEGDFSPSELAAAEPLAVLATEDATQRKARVNAWMAKERTREPSSILRESRIEALVRDLGDAEPASPKPAITRAELEAAVVAGASGADPRVKVRRDPEKARGIAGEGQTALRSGQWDEASKRFHAALDYDANCASALIGLSDLSFERADHSAAVKYARMAVNAAPKHSGYRIKYGDALLKVLEYQAAREQYERARALGNAAAKGRLEKLNAKLGR